MEGKSRVDIVRLLTTAAFGSVVTLRAENLVFDNLVVW